MGPLTSHVGRSRLPVSVGTAGAAASGTGSPQSTVPAGRLALSFPLPTEFALPPVVKIIPLGILVLRFHCL